MTSDTTVRRVTVLGSTGSVGRNTLDLVRRNRAGYAVAALTAFSRADDLAAQIREFEPEFAVIGDPALYQTVRDAAGTVKTEIAAGPEALIEAGRRRSDWVMAGIIGAAGLAPTLAAIERGAMVAFANKECLVCAGEMVMAAAARSKATLLPADSEHNAIFQVLEDHNRDHVEKLILTASGGPFAGWSRDQMISVTREQALAHPNWDMGAKISIDSATMMNKGLEIIEAHYLFAMPEDRIEVVVHPQSIVHSMVQYGDGSVLAQLGSPDMRIPIAHTLAWPQRLAFQESRLDFAAVGQLTFHEPDMQAFPALGLARQALKSGGSAPTVLNAANEVAVACFLEGTVGFLDIADLAEEALAESDLPPVGSIEDAIAVDTETRRATHALVARRNGVRAEGLEEVHG